MSKFKVGDEVVVVKNCGDIEEGSTGTVIHTLSERMLNVCVKLNNFDTNLFFEESELELLSSKSEAIQTEVKPESALDKQISGDHYKSCGIQPIEYIHANGLSYLEGNVIKYTTRHSKKNGRQDIEKAIHYLELILEMEYKDK